MREPIWIEGVEVPLKDGKYEVYGDAVEVNILASDICNKDGSGITRLELWVGEIDDTPDEMPGLRLLRDDSDYPADNDYTYTWDTTEKKDGEPLFPDGDYTLKAIAFDQAGNKKEATLLVEVTNLPKKYLHIRVEPCYVLAHNTDKTDPFTIHVQVYNYGSSGTIPEGGVNKKGGTQSYKIADGRPVLETCYTDQVEEATEDNTFNGIMNISTMFSGVAGISLYKEDWDGTIELTNGSGNVSGIRYKTDDGSDLDDSGQILVKAEGEGIMGKIQGNNLLLINPTKWSVIDSWVRDDEPDANMGYGTATQMYSGESPIEEGNARFRVFVKVPTDFIGTTYLLYIYSRTVYPKEGGRSVNVHETSPDWSEGGITWNNKPALGNLITTLGPPSPLTWHTIKTKGATSICLKFVNDGIPGEGQGYFSNFNSQQHFKNRPYFLTLP